MTGALGRYHRTARRNSIFADIFDPDCRRTRAAADTPRNRHRCCRDGHRCDCRARTSSTISTTRAPGATTRFRKSNYVLLNNTYNILILLDRARRAHGNPTVLCEVLREVMAPRWDPPQFRRRFPVRARCAWYMPPLLGVPWFLFVRIEAFQWVMTISK